MAQRSRADSWSTLTNSTSAASVISIRVGEAGWNLNRWQKRGDVPAISKEQLGKLQLKY